MKRYWLLLFCLGPIAGCTPPAIVNFPYNAASGQTLNSPAAELTPRIAGRYLVFASDRRGAQDIYLYDTLEKRLLELPGLNALDRLDSSPSVSQDGRYIVFAGSREGRTGIYLYDRTARQLRNLTEPLKAEVRNPTISADGNTIAFETSQLGQWDIAIIDRMGRIQP